MVYDVRIGDPSFHRGIVFYVLLFLQAAVHQLIAHLFVGHFALRHIGRIAQDVNAGIHAHQIGNIADLFKRHRRIDKRLAVADALCGNIIARAAHRLALQRFIGAVFIHQRGKILARAGAIQRFLRRGQNLIVQRVHFRLLGCIARFDLRLQR